MNAKDKECHGVTQKALNGAGLSKLTIPLPSLTAQRAIAEELDRICELKRTAEKLVEKYQQLVKSRFVEMFGDVVINDRAWAKVRFDEVTTSRLGKMLDAKQQTGKNKHKYLANFNVQWFRIDASELHEMDFDEADQKEFELKDGDLLVCEGGESGRSCVWRNQVKDCFYQKAIHRVRCDTDKLDPDYLSYWFWFSCANHAFDNIIGAKATIAHLPGVKLKALSLVLPPLSLQREFAAFVTRVDKLEFDAKQVVEKLDMLYHSKLQEYFS